MAGLVFTPSIFQNNVFQVGDVATATATASTSAGLTGHWRGPARKGRKKPMLGRTRLLSELDPKKDEPLFTPEEVLVEGPQQVNVDDETIKAMAMGAVAAMDAKIGKAMAEKRERERLAMLADEDDNFIMVM